MSRTIDSISRKASDYLGNSDHREGGLARPIEDFTASLPSDTFLWLGYASIATSLVFKIMGRDRHANFVGMWAPVFLIHGVYNKLVKQLGHDAQDNR
jgi:hypothetical protein